MWNEIVPIIVSLLRGTENLVVVRFLKLGTYLSSSTMDVSHEESKNQVAAETKGLDLNSLNLAPQGQGFLESLWPLVGNDGLEPQPWFWYQQKSQK